MITEVDKYRWKEERFDTRNNVFFSIDYLESVAISFHCRIHYYLYLGNNELSFGIALFAKNNRVFLPEYFTYNPVWFKSDLSERKKIEIFTSLVKMLKKQFRRINLKFNVDIIDVRAFKWEGFDVEIRYTYVRESKTKSHKTITNRLNKVPKNLYQSEIGITTQEDIIMNVKFLAEIGFKRHLRKKYEKLLMLWNQYGLLKSFRICNHENKTLSVFIVLLDKVSKKAYTLMINGASRGQEFTHAMVYDEITNWLDENDYYQVDFCGANYKGIAQFKSFFNPELKPYYVVSYSPFSKYLNPILRLINKF